MDDNCILELCDPDGLPVGQAIHLARAVSRVEPNLAPSLGAYVCYLADSAASDVRLMQRALELLCAVSDPRSFTATCGARESTGKRGSVRHGAVAGGGIAAPSRQAASEWGDGAGWRRITPQFRHKRGAKCGGLTTM